MWAEIIGAIFSGGATGLIGAGISRIGDYFKAKQDLEKLKLTFEHEMKMRDVDAKIMELEWQGRNQVAQTESDGKIAVSEMDAFRDSYQLEPKMYSSSASTTVGQNWMLVLLDFIRGFIRPGITAYLIMLVTIMYFIGSPDDKAQITKDVLFLSTTCVMWWFGIRSPGAKKK